MNWLVNGMEKKGILLYTTILYTNMWKHVFAFRTQNETAAEHQLNGMDGLTVSQRLPGNGTMISREGRTMAIKQLLGLI